MPMELLNRLSNEVMPAQLTQSKDVYNLHILRAAGHVYASIPLPYYAPDGQWYQEPATVHQVTPLGYKALRYFGPSRLDHAFEKDRDTVNGFVVPIR